MVKEPDRAEINAVLRRDGKAKIAAGENCPNCGKTVLVEVTDDNGKGTSKIVCPNEPGHQW